MTFQAWIRELIDARFGTATGLATALDMKLTVFTRGVAAGTFSIVNLLKLAKVARADASEVLRLAGKADVAALIEDLYGKSALTPEQREWLMALAETPAPLRGVTLDLVRGTTRTLAAALPHARTDESVVARPGRANAGRTASRRR